MEENNYRPVLKPNGYRSENNLFLKEPLFNYAESPVIAYGEDQGNFVAFQQANSEDELKEKLETIKSKAIQNLEKINIEYEIQDLNGEKMLSLNRHEYTCEKILDKPLMKKVQEELGNGAILVAIPFQGALVAVSASSNLRLKLPGLAKNYFENPQGNAISPHVYQLFDGNITAVGGEDISNGDLNGIIERIKNGDHQVNIYSKNMDEFSVQVGDHYKNALLLVMQDKASSGKIIFNQTNKDFQINDEVVNRCKIFITKVEENEMAQTMVTAMTNNKLSVEFRKDGKDFLNSTFQEEEVAKKKPWWKFW